MLKHTFAALFVSAAALLPLTSAHAQEEKEVEIKVGNVITQLKDTADWINTAEIKPLDTTKVYAVDIWSTSAPVCKRTVPYLNTLYQELGPKGLVVLGAIPEKKSHVKKYMLDKPYMTYPLVTLVKDDDEGAGSGESEFWKLVGRHSDAFPASFIVNRKGQICYVGGCLDLAYERILRLCLDDHFDTELNKQAAPILGAARRAAKVRNYKEASRLYDQVVALGPGNFIDISLEHWRMLSEQVLDQKAAKEHLNKTIKALATDEAGLIWIGNYMATNPEIKNRDLDAAKGIMETLSKRAKRDAENLACVAAIQAATGDVKGAAETQYDAWLEAPGSQKPRMKRSLDNYRAGIAQPGSDSISTPMVRPDDTGKTDTGGKPAESGSKPASKDAPASPGGTSPK